MSNDDFIQNPTPQQAAESYRKFGPIQTVAIRKIAISKRLRATRCRKTGKAGHIAEVEFLYELPGKDVRVWENIDHLFRGDDEVVDKETLDQDPTPSQAAAEAATSSEDVAPTLGLDWRPKNPAPAHQSATESPLDKLLRARASIIFEIADRAGGIERDTGPDRSFTLGEVSSLTRALEGVELAISGLTGPRGEVVVDISRWDDPSSYNLGALHSGTLDCLLKHKRRA